jgi:hypothetical protein
MFVSPLLATTILGFLDDKPGAPSWAAPVAKP